MKMGQKVLMIMLRGIGDIIMTFPAFEQLKTILPDAKIYHLVGDDLKEIAELNPVAETKTITSKFRSIKDLLLGKKNLTIIDLLFGSYILGIKEAIKLRQQKFDIIINFHRDWRLHIFTFLVGGRIRIGFEGGMGSLFNTKVLRRREYEKLHEATKNIMLVNLLRQGGNKNGKWNTNIRYRFRTTEKHRKKVASILKAYDLGNKKLIGFVVGGGKWSRGHINRRWPLKNWKKLIDILDERLMENYKIILFGGRNEVPTCHTLQIENQRRCINLCNKLSLGEVVELMKKLSCVVTTDTGLMHLASGCTNVIALFGPTSPKQFAPLGKQHKIITKEISCSPCYIERESKKYKNCNNNKCMKKISPKEVAHVIERFCK